ncbi:hypothetical protein D210916BOD24_02810 [Alteromonas sp. D210916BOD_24]
MCSTTDALRLKKGNEHIRRVAIMTLLLITLLAFATCTALRPVRNTSRIASTVYIQYTFIADINEKRINLPKLTQLI